MPSDLFKQALQRSLQNQTFVELYWDQTNNLGFELACVLELLEEGPLYAISNEGSFDGLLFTPWEEIYAITESSKYIAAAEAAHRDVLEKVTALKLAKFGSLKRFLDYLAKNKVPIELKFSDDSSSLGVIETFDSESIGLHEINLSTLRFNGIALFELSRIITVVSHCPDHIKLAEVASTP